MITVHKYLKIYYMKERENRTKWRVKIARMFSAQCKEGFELKPPTMQEVVAPHRQAIGAEAERLWVSKVGLWVKGWPVTF